MIVLDVILGLAVLALLIYRQLAARPVNASALRLIAILAVIGLIQAYQFLSKGHNHLLTFAALGSLALAAIFGALRASTVRVWVDDGQAWSQGNWVTAVLWIASLVAHLGYDVLVVHGPGARGLGPPPLSSTWPLPSAFSGSWCSGGRTACSLPGPRRRAGWAVPGRQIRRAGACTLRGERVVDCCFHRPGVPGRCSAA